MVRKTKRINIVRTFMTHDLYDGEKQTRDLDCAEETKWQDEKALAVDEGDPEVRNKKIPLLDLNIMQGASNYPVEAEVWVKQEAQDAYEKAGLGELDVESDEWMMALSEAISYLSVDVDDDESYGKRYRYHLWRSLREENPALQAGAKIRWNPTEEESEEENESGDKTKSAAEANW